jgi:NAD(P)-dependent dehydrogenase (short-subunit alcohol dehydrogenase family)
MVGRSAEKGAELGREANAGDRLHFIAADLTLVSENRRVIAEVTERLGRVDALVLCAA